MKIYNKNIKIPQNSQNAGGGLLDNRKKAFTLVEVVVTVIIIWILATIGYLSFWWYTWEARDTARHKDLKTISNVLEYELSLWKDLPAPDGNLVSESYEIAWKTYNFKTGEFGTNANNYFVWKLSWLPVDPETWAKYRYSLSEDGRYYILQATMNNWEVYKFSNLNDANKGLVATVKTPINGSNKNNSNSGNSSNSEDEGDSVDNTPPTFWVQNWTVFNVVYGGYADMNQIIATDDRKWKINYSYNPTKINTLWDPRWYTENATITATDAAWNSSSVNIVFKIARKYTAPTWNKNNFSVVKLEKWQTVNHSDVIATDEVDWVLTVKRDSDVNVNKPGEYVVKYSAKNRWDVTSELVIKYVVWGDKSDLKFTSETDFRCVVAWWRGTIIRYDWTDKDIEIPTTCNWVRIDSIITGAFRNKWLTSVYWPSIKEIWSNAFQWNQLKTAIFPDLVTVGNEAFSWNQLTSINYQELKNIWYSAFNWNKLISINIPKVEIVWGYSFYGNKLTTIYLKELKKISMAWFANNNLTLIDLPKLEIIEAYSFNGNQIESMNIPSIKRIDWESFVGNKFQTVTLPSTLKSIWAGVFNSNPVIIVINNSTLTKDQIEQAFEWNYVREYNWESIN